MSRLTQLGSTYHVLTIFHSKQIQHLSKTNMLLFECPSLLEQKILCYHLRTFLNQNNEVYDVAKAATMSIY